MKTNTLLKISAGVFAITSLLSCMNYYKISKSPQNTSTPGEVIRNNPQRYFILRSGDSAYHMNNISNYKDSLTCYLETLPPEHKLHLRNGRGGHMRFKKYKPEAAVLNEAHVYEKQDNSAKAGEGYKLMYSSIRKIEVLVKNKSRTTTSYILGGIAIASPFIFIIVAAAAGGGLPECWGC